MMWFEFAIEGARFAEGLVKQVRAATIAPVLVAEIGKIDVQLPLIIDRHRLACLLNEARCIAQRRQDILPLSRQFLQEKEEGSPPPVHRSAEHALVSQRYSYGNASELREAVEMAALFAEGEEIRAEHLFTGPKEESSAAEFDLGSLPLVQRLISDKSLGAIRALVLASFSAIILLCLFRSRATEGHLANALIWGAWEPALSTRSDKDDPRMSGGRINRPLAPAP